MKKQFGFLMLALVAAAGCNMSTTGGPGAPDKTTPPATTTAHKPATEGPVNKDSRDTFSLTAPTLSTHVKPGESTTASFSIHRGKDFAEDVAVRFEGIPEGVTIEPPTPVLKNDDKELKIHIHAAESATPGDSTIHLTAHPTIGADAKVTFKVTVDAK